MEETRLGNLVHSSAKRDAIHIAVAPLRAKDDFEPGQLVALDHGWAVHADEQHPAIGVADPFLECRASKGRWFYVLLTPGTVTSMRHEWQHPAFGPTESEEWLGRVASDNRIDYDEMIEGARTGEGCLFGDTSGPEIARDCEFWEHLENVTGEHFDQEHRTNTPFRCSC